jgi:molybdopterin synthase catalytic subunit
MLCFSLKSVPINVSAIVAAMDRPSVGALVSFEGRVRDHHDGHRVTKLVYQAYADLATSEGSRVLEEANRRFSITSIQCQHRIGELDISEIAILVAVSAAHRDAAFNACRYVIDEMKMRLPIWKLEFYGDAAAQWRHPEQGQIATVLERSP